ncbi:hypothetical protein AC1031_004263 [Aphanomyces cochlioides]|nr:hypothetical protein AC1031_004263 [Aphanomyces cochlioides]
MHDDIILNREPSASEIQAVERSKDLSLKLSAIENDRNFVYLPKEQTWLNAKVQRPVDRSEAFRFYGHKSKNSTLAWVQFGAALCGGKEVVHRGCLATVLTNYLAIRYCHLGTSSSWFHGHVDSSLPTPISRRLSWHLYHPPIKMPT